MNKKDIIVVTGVISSLIIFIILFYLQKNNSNILNLESRWLLLAGIPILLALFIGGYIQKFKGLGIEIEARLQNKIGKIGLQAVDALEQAEGQDKGSLSFLYDTPSEELSKKERLILVLGRRNYYESFALKEYIERLGNLKYIELQDNRGAFQYLIPLSAFKHENYINYELIEKLIKNLEGRKLEPSLESKAETDYISITEKLISILPKVRESTYGWLPVLNKRKHLVGVVTKEGIESRIADEVLTAKETV